MAYNVAFTIASLSVPGTIILTDTSTGSDPNLSTRTIGLYQADGTLLGGALIAFPYSEGNIKTITIGADYSLNIVLTAISSSPLPPPSAYSASGLFTFDGFSNQFLDSLIGSVAFQFTTVGDTNFKSNTYDVTTLIRSAQRAGQTNQQAAAQQALSRIQWYINNQNVLF